MSPPTYVHVYVAFDACPSLRPPCLLCVVLLVSQRLATTIPPLTRCAV